MVAIFPNVWFGRYDPEKLYRATLLHRIALVSFRLFRKNLGNLEEFFGQMVYPPPSPPPQPKIARSPMSQFSVTEPAEPNCSSD